MVYKFAIKNHHQQESDSLKLDAAKLNLKVSKAIMYPNFSVGYNIASAFSNYISNIPFKEWWKGYGNQLSDNFNQQVALNFNIPLFNNGRNKFGYDQAKVSLRDAEYIKEQDNIELKKNIYSIYSSANFSFKKYISAERMINGLQATYDILLNGYETGGVNILDLITSQNSLLKAKIQQIITKYDYAFKVKILEFYRGN